MEGKGMKDYHDYVFTYTEEGYLKHYKPVWYSWPYGKNSHNLIYEEHQVLCPECEHPLEPVDVYREDRSVYVCPFCETQYIGYYCPEYSQMWQYKQREPELIPKVKPTPKKEEKQVANDFMKKYAYILK